ncbi:MAG TPA: glycogen debranching enzyme, partial [Pirellulales bacterium]|nr:glycogen debranching enzyme [Pirellulales bacterium]
RRTTFLTGGITPGTEIPDVSWFSADGQPIDWNNDQSLICRFGTYQGPCSPRQSPRHVLILLHAGERQRVFTIPASTPAIEWRLFVDTASKTPLDVYPNFDGPAPPMDGQVTLLDHSLKCYVSAE